MSPHRVSPGQPGDVIVLRPDLDRYRSWLARPDARTLAFAAVIVGGGAIAALVSGSAARILAVVGLIVLGVVIGLGGALLSMRTSSVTLTPDTIEHRRWFVRRTVLRISDGLRGVLADYRPPVEGRSSDLLVLQRADGKGPVIRLNGAFWQHDDLALIASRAGVVPEQGALRAKHFEKRAPGIMHWRERHWVLFVTATPIAFVVVLVAVLAVAVSRGWLGEPDFSDEAVAQQNSTRGKIMGALDLSWRTDAVVESCDEGRGDRRIVSARARIPRDDVLVTNTSGVATRLSEIVTAQGYDQVDDSSVAGSLQVTARASDADASGPEVRVADADGYLTVHVSTRCESGD